MRLLHITTALIGLLVGAQAGAASVALDWTSPTERTSGAELSENALAGYRIYYGPSPAATDSVVEITDPEQTRYEVEGLEPGREYYFAITAYDRMGRESAKSNRIRIRAGD